ncbi:TPA: hypothetical protein ACXDAY_002290 [Clostridium botulinum]|uniref:hypothetical protein n=1 Tax=Clostridium botulinum TaxID=1491 RepID=UPI0004655A27|nr:hypothetical protein [Clostridium botulinum]APH20803.1 hypothetical protein NPD1_4081 [Clostridium botulinum]APQ71326.1 hypothetical protein RSJ8_4317 [Clostridium botulinum]APR02509.1 hypothetical protein RSJ2_4181 [Clostridium botulinum]MBN3359399.1 hypothetical protein [Clostridium botulinum]MBN3379103.1 hypothetical protein [Clostridium botulinum]
MIKLKNTYLGYTNNLKAIQKAKIENILDSKGTLCIQKDFILNRIKEGYKPSTVKNYSCYSERLKRTVKRKTDYRLTDEAGAYYTINKTLFKFAKYIIDNNFTDDTIREKFILEEQIKQNGLSPLFKSTQKAI